VRIEARGVTKRFGRVQALRGVGFEVPAGGRVALVGPNGSGKSTLNRVLMGLVACDEGEVRVDGRSPLRERVAIARGLAYVPQAAPQSGVPVREIAGVIARLRGLATGDMAKLAERLELDLDAVGASPLRALSGGTRQKLLLALALASRASLLVLDEPTASLDATARERFFGLFAELPRETTLLLCSHRLEEIRPLVDRVLALDEGRVVYDGAAAGFLDARALSVVEVSAAADAAAWLRSRGFRRGAGGWWLRSVARGEKPELVRELLRELGPSLRDLNVREIEGLELEVGAVGTEGTGRG
jgi:ABC-2 type transport system ATP-binding protein